MSTRCSLPSGPPRRFSACARTGTPGRFSSTGRHLAHGVECVDPTEAIEVILPTLAQIIRRVAEPCLDPSRAYPPVLLDDQRRDTGRGGRRVARAGGEEVTEVRGQAAGA